MPKLPENLTDWTAPWEKEGREFNADEAKGLVFNLMRSEEKLKTEKATLRSERDTLATEKASLESKLEAKPGEESAKDARISELSAQVKKLEGGLPSDKSYIEKLEVALETGGGKLSLRDAKRLVGETRDELIDDASYLAERFAPPSEGGEGGGSAEGSRPPSRQPVPSSNLGNGSPPSGHGDQVLSVEQLLAQEAKSLSETGGLHLPNLTR